MKSRGSALRWLLALGLVAAGCSPVERSPRNLLLISLDTLVPDRMSAYGNERRTTPAIDDLLDDAVRFDNAFSTSSWTLPAHASMLSGFYPKSLSDNPSDDRLYRVAPLLAERFQQRGYQTAAFTGGGYVGSLFGLDRGFDQFEGKENSKAAVAWLEAHAGRPFFLFFHTYKPHAAYRDRRYVEAGAGGRIASIFTLTAGGRPAALAVFNARIRLTPTEREFLMALYDGGVAAADEMVEELISALKRLDLLESTTVIVTSDHGEEFWQHTGRAAYHGHTLYDELLRIPLIWYETDMGAGGDAEQTAVSLVDLVPTLLARFDLAGPAVTDGVDLSPLLDGGEWQLERPLFAEGILHGPARFSIRTNEGKLVWTPRPNAQHNLGRMYPVPVLDRVELYLPADPGEQRNVSDRHPELRDQLMSELEAHVNKPSADLTNIEPVPLSDEVREELRALGYVDPVETPVDGGSRPGGPVAE